jgi:hypothetical protein
VDRFLFGLADVLLAVVSSLVIASGTVAAALCDDILVFSRLEGFAIVPRFVCANWAGIAYAGDGGLGGGCGGCCQEQGEAEPMYAHGDCPIGRLDSWIVIVCFFRKRPSGQ